MTTIKQQLNFSIMNSSIKKKLESIEHPRAFYFSCGMNVIATKLKEPIRIKHRGGDALIVSANGLDIKGEGTFGVKYGPNFKFYETISISELE